MATSAATSSANTSAAIIDQFNFPDKLHDSTSYWCGKFNWEIEFASAERIKRQEHPQGVFIDSDESVFGVKREQWFVGRIDSQAYAAGTAHGACGDLTGRRKNELGLQVLERALLARRKCLRRLSSGCCARAALQHPDAHNPANR
jgi:hypothetical protein